MEKGGIPLIDSRYVCIATHEQGALAAVVSSYFTESNLFFPVLEFPKIDTPYTPSRDFGKDGYVGRIMGERAAVEINNCLARIQPKWVLLVGMTENQKSYFRHRLPVDKLIEIDSLDHIPSRLLSLVQVGIEPIRCKTTQITEGLLLAKFSSKPLAIDDSAPPLPTAYINGGEGILLIENDLSVCDVAAINYAFAINADVALVPAIDKKDARALPRQLEAWSKDRSHHEFQWARKAAAQRLKGLNVPGYKFATFFTRGLPYGLFLKNVIPCSHVMKELDCGLFITNALIEEHAPLGLGSAVVFSPELFSSEEIDDISRILDENNYIVTEMQAPENVNVLVSTVIF